MKTEIKRINDTLTFKPFTIEIDVQSIDEARYLLHITNCYGIIGILKEQEYWENKFADVNEDFINDDDIAGKIQNEIEEQGFDI